MRGSGYDIWYHSCMFVEALLNSKKRKKRKSNKQWKKWKTIKKKQYVRACVRALPTKQPLP